MNRTRVEAFDVELAAITAPGLWRQVAFETRHPENGTRINLLFADPITMMKAAEMMLKAAEKWADDERKVARAK